MASSLKCFACFFIISLISTQIHARESQFFSKVSATTTATPTTTTTTTVNNKDQLLNKNNEQDPSFIPETQNAYGLYGQESSQYPTTTKLAATDTYTTTPITNNPYKTQQTYTTTPTTNNPYKTQQTYTNNNNNENYYYNSNNNDQFNNVNAYEDEQQNMQLGETRLQDTGYTTTAASENQNNNKYYYNGGSGYNNVEKQGMSDTRFMENGKYFYDANNENNNNYYTNDQYHNTKANYENTRGGLYSNNKNENYFYNSNNNEYNNMERPQNVENFQNDQYDP